MTSKLCATCGRELPLEAFKQHAKSPDGYTLHCKECLSQRRANKNIEGGGNPELVKFKSRELIEELRYRGYKGVLEYTQKITI